MAIYDRACGGCGKQYIDCWEPMTTPDPLCTVCLQPTARVWLSKAPLVVGDEIDVTIKHGLCAPDGTPVRYRSRQAMNREAAKRGLFNRVEHIGTKGGDKSKVTRRWI